MMIQLREQRKLIPKKIVLKTLKDFNLCNKQEFHNYEELWYSKERLTQYDIESVTQFLFLKDILGEYELSYFLDIINLKLIVINDCVFLVSQCDNTSDYYVDLIREYGAWNAQGLNNHVHLRDCSRNPVVQYYLAHILLQKFYYNIKSLNLCDDFILYCNGKYDSTICIYLARGVDSMFLCNFDKKINIDVACVYCL